MWNIYAKAQKRHPRRFPRQHAQFSIPCSVLDHHALSAQEAIVAFLKEDYSLSFVQIAVVLHRDARTVWTAFQRAKAKQVGKVAVLRVGERRR